MPRPPPPILACLALLMLPALTPAHATAPVQRCIGPDGRAVYTDRRCDDVGAVSRLPATGAAEGPRMFRGGCPRLLSQLVGEIGAAIRNGDVNRLASVYDWSGVSDAAASRLLDQLEAMVERPLVDIAPVYAGPAGGEAPPLPEPPPAPAAPTSPPQAEGNAKATGPAAWMPSWSGTAPPAVDATAQPLPPVSAPVVAPPRPRPVALRVEQTLAGSATPVRTVFGLRRTYGCFWVSM